jgi:AbiU2
MSNVRPHMPKVSVLGDLVQSARSAKAHYGVWWALVSEARPKLVPTMNEHSDFFLTVQDAHFVAFHTYAAHLFDRRPGSASIPAYLKELKKKGVEARRVAEFEAEYKGLELRAKPVLSARHKIVAHVDARLTDSEVYGQTVATWNQIRDVIFEAAQFVAKLAGCEAQPGTIGIPHDRRLPDATLRLIRTLEQRGAA